MKNTPESISGSVERYFVTRCRNSGSALPLVILAVVMLLIMGTTLLSMGLNNRIYSLRNTSDIVARCAADAGLTQALFDMNQRLQAKTLNGQTMPYVYKRNLIDCDAHYSYLVTSNSGVYTIVSFGETENSQRIITAALGLQGIFDHAILTKDSLILKSGTTVDGYNSSDSSVTDVPVKIGTQSTEDDKIVLNNSVIVDGDVAVGMNGSVDDVIKDLGATVNGDKHVATSIEPLPEITVPPLAEMGTSLTVKSSTLSLTEADSGTYSKIDLQNGKNIGVLEVAAGENVELHITGDIDLGQDCEIIVRDGATLTIYVDGNINCSNGSGINTEAPPEKAATLQLYATGEGEQFLDIKAKSDWTGIIYAPNADVDLYAGGDAYGCVVADSFEFKAGGNFHYDEALKDVKIGDPYVRFVVTRWSEAKVNMTDLNMESLRTIDVDALLKK